MGRVVVLNHAMSCPQPNPNGALNLEMASEEGRQMTSKRRPLNGKGGAGRPMSRSELAGLEYQTL